MRTALMRCISTRITLWNHATVLSLACTQVTHISRVGGNLRVRKEDVRGAVFKPTVERPTMTVEEFGEVELERARQRQVREAQESSTF